MTVEKPASRGAGSACLHFEQPLSWRWHTPSCTRARTHVCTRDRARGTTKRSMGAESVVVSLRLLPMRAMA
eukprot:261471-Alexandrium_andersonii.AAC.1